MYNSIYIVDQEGGHMETLIFTSWLSVREGFLCTPNFICKIINEVFFI